MSYGTVFELSPGVNGWTEAVLYNFCSQGQGYFCTDGGDPQSGLTFDSSGNLYGAATVSKWVYGSGGGLIFKLSPNLGGWSESTVHDFADTRNAFPSSVTFDPSNNMYFEVLAGGAHGAGALISVSPTGHVSTFSFDGTDGSSPAGGVILDATGNIYATTSAGGNQGGVFKVGPKGRETVLHKFCSQANCADGSIPMAGVIQDKAGNLYGTTEGGGAYGVGVVFEIAPN